MEIIGILIAFYVTTIKYYISNIPLGDYLLKTHLISIGHSWKITYIPEIVTSSEPITPLRLTVFGIHIHNVSQMMSFFHIDFLFLFSGQVMFFEFFGCNLTSSNNKPNPNFVWKQMLVIKGVANNTSNFLYTSLLDSKRMNKLILTFDQVFVNLFNKLYCKNLFKHSYAWNMLCMPYMLHKIVILILSQYISIFIISHISIYLYIYI